MRLVKKHNVKYYSYEGSCFYPKSVYRVVTHDNGKEITHLYNEEPVNIAMYGRRWRRPYTRPINFNNNPAYKPMTLAEVKDRFPNIPNV
jgi:hypothetical protein